MQFDIILGNPPFNDLDGATDKKHGSKHMKTNLYPGFINLASKHIKPNGYVGYILPHGAFRYIYKSGLYVKTVLLNRTRVWGKQIPTRTWIAVTSPTTTNVGPTIFSKIAKWTHSRVLNRKMTPGYKLYNYIRPLRIYTADEVSKMEEKTANKNNAPIFIPHTVQNKKNLDILLTFFNRYLDQYAAMWGSYSKILDYDWIDGLTYDITEDDIKRYYNLTDGEVKEIKSY